MICKTNSYFVLSLLLLMFACSRNEEDCETCKTDLKDTTEVTFEEKDSDISTSAKVQVNKHAKDIQENHKKIVEKFGEQWDFCKCVVANDSITDAFEKKLNSAQETKLMARWEYVDSKCKELITMPNTTPEERAKHDKKVNDCLKANGLKK